MKKLTSVKDLEIVGRECASEQLKKPKTITVCSETGCLTCGSSKLADAFESEIERQGLSGTVSLRRSACLGFCERGPVSIILPQKICYLQARPEDVPEIVQKTLGGNEIVERLVYKDTQTGVRLACVDDIPFYKHQMRLLLANNAVIDAANIADYFAIGGYSALGKVLAGIGKDEVIEMIKGSKLRGRGGGGFPVGIKWQTTKDAPGEPKYVIVNGDEGDPGAFMDRSFLEGNPHGVLEGLIIGGYAIGANEGFFYIRQEYPVALENVQLAIEQARKCGLLGKDILGSGFDFDVKIHRGAGAFVSGESSALMNAIEGNVGEPRPKYIHTSEKGIWDKPSCLNNVETWANVPLIINNGVEWFKGIGTEASTGTKVFSLVGKVNNTGLVEVPMGIPLREIIFSIGGGVPKGKKFKAVQTGGPSGGVLPESLLDLPVDFDELKKAGSMMGSGGMIVMDEDTCMVDTARYYIEFLAHESCGKCIPCREGLRQMLNILNDITSGRGKEGDIELLEELSETLQEASLCALGQSAPNPVMSTIRHFRDEYEAHIREKRCPARVCKELITYEIDEEKCKGCGLCMKNCPAGAVEQIDKKQFKINQTKCIKCGACFTACPEKFSAVVKKSGKPQEQAVAA
ncbi:NADH-ubiquinone oxidoreductase NADH-binding 51 kD subunit [uncultured Desulfobacterium sp.]|uniref:NADH-ubiquinone oxidoreductase NADH-binding 51 kD subunit n=1 Tax=uncultured Desulfobacterium sp. TaxID=201089 RepID=A0A445MU45_9BACT|nr:NADH-ubiquinone oxidoreductase NADH-binding 51 kD subunit [uncultured Desulfobacterium sp.]